MNTAIWIAALVVVGVMLYSRFGGTITLPGLPKMDVRLAAFGGAALAAFYVLYRVHGLASQEVPGYEKTVGEWADYLLEDPILALSLLILFAFVVWKWRSQSRKSGATSGQQGAVVGKDEVWPDGVPIRANKNVAVVLPRKWTGTKALVWALIAFVGAVLLILASPSEWWLVHGEAYIPLRGAVFSAAFIIGWMFAVKDESGTMSGVMTWVVIGLLLSTLLRFHPMDVMFSPTPEKFPELVYIHGIRFSYIWAVTAFFTTYVALLGNPKGNSAWGAFIVLFPVLFLWNQIFVWWA